ncbi:MAG: hypothetical protein ACI9LM_002496 [Alteromonadaceae bacterium]|jgi:hypothetical protein
MYKSSCSYLLCLIIALQSIFAIADDHQPETEHILASSQLHQDAPSTLIDESSDSEHQECHHGHCHHSSVVFIFKEKLPLSNILVDDKYGQRQFFLASAHLNTDLRPPISS